MGSGDGRSGFFGLPRSGNHLFDAQTLNSGPDFAHARVFRQHDTFQVFQIIPLARSWPERCLSGTQAPDGMAHPFPHLVHFLRHSHFYSLVVDNIVGWLNDEAVETSWGFRGPWPGSGMWCDSGGAESGNHVSGGPWHEVHGGSGGTAWK